MLRIDDAPVPQLRVLLPVKGKILVIMPKEGIEPSYPSGYTSLSRARMPIPPLRPAPAILPQEQDKMKLGIIGFPQSGKTTLYNAVTRGHAPTTASAGRIEIHTAVVDVPDPRVDHLSAMF